MPKSRPFHRSSLLFAFSCPSISFHEGSRHESLTEGLPVGGSCGEPGSTPRQSLCLSFPVLSLLSSMPSSACASCPDRVVCCFCRRRVLRSSLSKKAWILKQSPLRELETSECVGRSVVAETIFRKVISAQSRCQTYCPRRSNVT